jgi:hypothetical protein
MTIVKTINVKETNDYSFVVYEDEFGFHAAFQFHNKGGKIRRLSGDMNRCGYKTVSGATRVINSTIKSMYLTKVR